MKKLLPLLLLVSLVACESDTTEYRWVCNEEQKAAVQRFITANVKGANNMSDEEMEDVIDALYRNGVKTTCGCREVKVRVRDHVVIKVYNLQKGETLMERVW